MIYLQARSTRLRHQSRQNQQNHRKPKSEVKSQLKSAQKRPSSLTRSVIGQESTGDHNPDQNVIVATIVDLADRQSRELDLAAGWGDDVRVYMAENGTVFCDELVSPNCDSFSSLDISECTVREKLVTDV